MTQQPPINEDPLAQLAAVPRRLRELRQRSGLRLEDVAARTGISVSTLSRLESGKRRPALDHVLSLCRVLDVTLDELVGRPLPDDPRIRPEPFERDGVTFIPLSRRSDGVVAFKSIHPPRPSARAVRALTHAGHEWLYVLRGQLRLTLGDREHLLDSGEAAEFDCRVPHALASATEDPVEVLNLMSPEGRRVHVRDV